MKPSDVQSVVYSDDPGKLALFQEIQNLHEQIEALQECKDCLIRRGIIQKSLLQSALYMLHTYGHEEDAALLGKKMTAYQESSTCDVEK